MNLSNEVKLTLIKAPTTGAATGDVVADVLDMQNYQGVLAFATYGTANSSNGIKAGMSSASSSGTMGDMVGTQVAGLSTGGTVWLDIQKPLKRYVQFTLTRQASAKLSAVYALQYGARLGPVDNTIADLITGELHASPTTGTA